MLQSAFPILLHLHTLNLLVSVTAVSLSAMAWLSCSFSSLSVLSYFWRHSDSELARILYSVSCASACCSRCVLISSSLRFNSWRACRAQERAMKWQGMRGPAVPQNSATALYIFHSVSELRHFHIILLYSESVIANQAQNALLSTGMS